MTIKPGFTTVYLDFKVLNSRLSLLKIGIAYGLK